MKSDVTLGGATHEVKRQNLTTTVVNSVVRDFGGDIRRTKHAEMLVATPAFLYTNEVFHIVAPNTAAPSLVWGSFTGTDAKAEGAIGLQPLVYELLPVISTRSLNHKRYELTDHLGNVRAVVTDRKLCDNSALPTQPTAYRAEVLNQTDFYPFGMISRSTTASGGVYRFSFQGQEKDDEVFGATGTSMTAEYWQYDTRTGRRWNIDPITFPWQSTYTCFNNNPIYFIDPRGLFGTKAEAKQYKKDNDVKGKLKQGDDGTWSIDSKKGGYSIWNDTEQGLGIVKGALVLGGPEYEKGNTGRDDRRDGDRRRNWRDRNYGRGLNASTMDERGTELLGRWLNGSGEPLYVEGGNWGNYMKDNELLDAQIKQVLEEDAKMRSAGGAFSYTGFAEIENGYITGYEMLHGTHAGVGGFTMNGTVTMVNASTVEYKLTLAWHDVIDPNPIYAKDVTAANILEMFYSPKDYEVHIRWGDKITINR